MAGGGARGAAALSRIAAEIVRCRACPRLVAWREKVARERRRAYRDEVYWGKPVPGFGDPAARIAIVGLAPGAHGANRTGRMFTGDGSGDFLYAALHRAGLASQAESRSRGDGLRLRGVFVAAAARCAPPANRLAPGEIERCAPFLERELKALPGVRVLLALGAVAWGACLRYLVRIGRELPAPRPRFGHAAELRVPGGPVLVGSYHVSRQNTQTGRLTPAMFDEVVRRVVEVERQAAPGAEGPSSE
jgi:uracil-DNA glycosylase family 4